MRAFERCQLYGWKDRMACCASVYKVGSLEMKQCLYQYLGTKIVFDEMERLAYCQKGNPPGSQHFQECLRYPIDSCALLANDRTGEDGEGQGHNGPDNDDEGGDDGDVYDTDEEGGDDDDDHGDGDDHEEEEEHDDDDDDVEDMEPYGAHRVDDGGDRGECCKHYFEDDGLGFDACLGRRSFQDLLQSYYDQNRDWMPLSNSNWPSERRVAYCTENFDLKQGGWYRYACLAEITFSAHDRSLYHFTLFSDSAVTGDAQFACAIYDETERERCCSVTYPVSSQAYDSCLSWAPTLGFEKYQNVTMQEDRYLEDELSKTMQEADTSAITQPQPANTSKVSLHKQRMGVFLKKMKAVEEELSERPNGNVVGSGAEVVQAYQVFRSIVRRAIEKNETGTFYHGVGMDWITCALIRSDDASKEDCVLYCGKLALLDEKKVPHRKPVLRWEGGALSRLMEKARRRMLETDRQSEPAVSSEPDASDAMVINLLGGQDLCPYTNLAYTCNALCCDSYFAECWLCGWQNLQCVG